MPKRTILLAALLLILLLADGSALAQNGDDLSWWTVDGGGGSSNGGSYRLSGTIGQTDVRLMHGGEYTLSGGFWIGAVGAPGPGRHPLYLPVILHGD